RRSGVRARPRLGTAGPARRQRRDRRRRRPVADRGRGRTGLRRSRRQRDDREAEQLMDFLSPRSWTEALAAKADRPDAVPISGGTDLMVDINFDRRRPDALLDLNGVPELTDWQHAADTVRIG